MIRNIEIQEAARAWGLRPDIVEKDYVLGWLLMGLSAHPRIQTQWIFKGGTALKKCYVETYRFSEDLDFTLTPGASQNLDEMVSWISSICANLSNETGAEFPPAQIEFRAHPNPRGGVTLRAKLAIAARYSPARLLNSSL